MMQGLAERESYVQRAAFGPVLQLDACWVRRSVSAKRVSPAIFLLFAFGVNISVARRLTACQIGKLDETANHTTGLTNQNKLPPLTQGQAITTLDT